MMCGLPRRPRSLGNMEIIAEFLCGRKSPAEWSVLRATVWHRHRHQFRAVRIGRTVVSERKPRDLHHVQRSADCEAVGGQEELGRACSRLKVNVVGRAELQVQHNESKEVFVSFVARHDNDFV
jgi:hypothetical protein